MTIQFESARDPVSSIVKMAAQDEADAVGHAPAIYLSEALLALEYETIFKHQWACVGRTDEFVDPGDYLTTEIGLVPVIVTMRANGTLGAMVNVCSHRMSTVASGAGNAKRFSCPYHGWTYDGDGTLIGAPRMPADFDTSACALKAVKVERWNGFVYVNIDPDAPPLAESLQPLEALFRNFHMEKMRSLHKGREIWNCNWKIATENFLESYHLEMTHAATIGPLFPQETLRMVSEGPNHSFHAFSVGDELLQPQDPAIALDNPDLTDDDRHIVYVGGVFPNHLFTVAFDQFTWMRAQPMGVDRTLVEWGICGAFDIPRGTAPDASHPNLYYLHEIPLVNAEDRGIVERVQKGARSGMVTPSRLQANESGLVNFARFLARCLSEKAA
jgi:phenylpropionate dioxygenase-like ring-hydroxylating dioxygenase large terminal subunit